ncbi:MAG: hypothetical protein M3173_00395, partial [Chloroflexota bacterium]|nr:hypothetical protein [Chloroflexota bacterium]
LKVRPMDKGYRVLTGTLVDGYRTEVPTTALGGSASSAWDAPGSESYALAWDSPATPATGRVQLVAAADFDDMAAGYSRAGTLSFQFIADFGECSGT